jgi:hypothetical protein
VLFGLGAFGAERIPGLGRYVERTDFVRNNPWSTSLFGLGMRGQSTPAVDF